MQLQNESTSRARYGATGAARRITAPGGRSITTRGATGALSGAATAVASVVVGALAVRLNVLPGTSSVGAIG